MLNNIYIYKIETNIMNFMEISMKEWKTDLKLYHGNGIIEVKKFNIKRGIYNIVISDFDAGCWVN